MTNKQLKLATALTCALGLVAPASVFATNGMFMIGAGSKARSMGGVSITMTHDTFASSANPATMAEVKGNRFDIGGDIFTATATAYMGQDSHKKTEDSKPEFMTVADGVYVMPAIGASWNKGEMSFGFTMVLVGGGGSLYNYNLYNCANATPADCNDQLGVTLLIFDINPTIAMKLDNQNSIGATLIIGMQAFKAEGLTQFTQFTTTQDNTANLTNKGTELAYGAGIRLGWLGHYMDDKLRLGAAYTSKTYMTKFKEYSDLFAEQGKMDTPGNIGVGISYDFTDDTTVALDINYIMYEGVAAVSNPGPPPGGGLEGPFPVSREENALGKDNGLGFGWSNQTVFKLGLIYQYDPKWTLRGGWNYAKSPIDEKTDILFSMVAPAVVQNHLTLGGTYQLSSDMELSFSYIHAFEFEQYGPTYINYEAGYKMSQDALGASFSMNF